MNPLLNYTKEELIIKAETLEEYGEYLHDKLIGYSPKELRVVAAMTSLPSYGITPTRKPAYARKE